VVSGQKPLYINVAMKKGEKAHGLQPFCFWIFSR
jgi:hypothetical protein